MSAVDCHCRNEYENKRPEPQKQNQQALIATWQSPRNPIPILKAPALEQENPFLLQAGVFGPLCVQDAALADRRPKGLRVGFRGPESRGLGLQGFGFMSLGF